MPINDPTDLAGLGLWLRADSLALNNGDPVGLWSDESVNAFNFTGGGAQRPTFTTNVLNGHPALIFDGADDTMASAIIINPIDTWVSAAGDATTIFVVMYQNGVAVNNTILFWSVSTVNSFNVLASFGDTLYLQVGDGAGPGSLGVAQPAGWDNVWHILELQRDGASAEIVVDGIVAGTGPMTDSLDANSLILYIGSVAGAPFLNGGIAEIVIYKRALTSGERQDVYDYLNDKYAIVADAITTTLPLLATGAFYEPEVTPGAVTITLPLLASGAFYEPEVTTGPTTVILPLLATGAFYSPTISYAQTIILSLLASGAFYQPTVTVPPPPPPEAGVTFTISDRAGGA